MLKFECVHLKCIPLHISKYANRPENLVILVLTDIHEDTNRHY